MTFEAEEEIISQIRTVLNEWKTEAKLNSGTLKICPYCGYSSSAALLLHSDKCAYTKIARIIGESHIQRIK